MRTTTIKRANEGRIYGLVASSENTATIGHSFLQFFKETTADGRECIIVYTEGGLLRYMHDAKLCYLYGKQGKDYFRFWDARDAAKYIKEVKRRRVR